MNPTFLLLWLFSKSWEHFPSHTLSLSEIILLKNENVLIKIQHMYEEFVFTCCAASAVKAFFSHTKVNLNTVKVHIRRVYLSWHRHQDKHVWLDAPPQLHKAQVISIGKFSEVKNWFWGFSGRRCESVGGAEENKKVFKVEDKVKEEQLKWLSTSLCVV